MQVPGFVFNPLMLLIEGSAIGFLIAVPVGPAAALCIRRSITVGALAAEIRAILGTQFIPSAVRHSAPGYHFVGNRGE